MPVVALLIALTLLFAATSDVAPAAPGDMRQVQMAQLTIERRIIIRIPMMRPPPPAPELAAPPEPPAEREKRGPKCLKLKRIKGAVVNQETGLTMITDKNERLRAHLGRTCRATDFYSGFYIEPNKDGELCAGRDVLHARNGSSCDIETFGKLVSDD